MSYILDALRKSDQQRRRGAAPTLLPMQADAAGPKRLAPLIYVALVLILLGAGIAIGWLRPWQPAPAGPAPLAAAVKPSAPVQEAAPPQQLVIVPSAQPALQAQTAAPPAVSTQAAAAAAPAPVAEEQDEEVRRPRRGAAPRTGAAPKSPAPPVPMAGAAAGATAQASTIVAMKELPVAVQQELPPMSISVHAYSRIVAERLVGINNRLLHEGDEVAPGLRLEQITPEGMVLSFKGYSFRRGVH